MKKIFTRIFLLPLLSLVVLQAGLFIYLDDWDWPQKIERIIPYTVFSTLFIFIVTGVYSLWIANNITSPMYHMMRRLKKFPEPTPAIHQESRLEEINEFYSTVERFMELMGDQMKGLSLEKELLSSLLNNLREGVLCLNSEGTVIFRNEAIDMELVEEKAVGRPYFKVVRHPRMLQCINDRVQEEEGREGGYRPVRLASEEMQKPVEFRQGRKHFKMMCYPILMDERLELFLIIIQDDTREQNIKRLREDFLQNASHELKTPITSIRGYAETIQYKSKDEKLGEFAGAILRNVQRMERLIEDMTTISSLESGLFPFNPEVIHLDSFMMTIRELVIGNLKQRTQNLIIRIEYDPPQVFADPLLMEHLLLNLIVNASRYSPESTTITVTVNQLESGHIQFAISDEGPGVEEEFRDKIFERFFRVDRNRSRSQGGTGLGLSIVRQITRLHGGDVRVENGENGGAVFRVNIPGQ